MRDAGYSINMSAYRQGLFSSITYVNCAFIKSKIRDTIRQAKAVCLFKQEFAMTVFDTREIQSRNGDKHLSVRFSIPTHLINACQPKSMALVARAVVRLIDTCRAAPYESGDFPIKTSGRLDHTAIIAATLDVRAAYRRALRDVELRILTPVSIHVESSFQSSFHIVLLAKILPVNVVLSNRGLCLVHLGATDSETTVALAETVDEVVDACRRYLPA